MRERVRRLRPEPPAPDPAAVLRARREAGRQLEWAEVYLAAAEGLPIDDPAAAGELRRLRGAVRRLAEGLRRPRVL